MLKLKSSCEERHLGTNLSVVFSELHVNRLIEFASFWFFFADFSYDFQRTALDRCCYVYGNSARISADRNALLSLTGFSSVGIEIGV